MTNKKTKKKKVKTNTTLQVFSQPPSSSEIVFIITFFFSYSVKSPLFLFRPIIKTTDIGGHITEIDDQAVRREIAVL